MGNSRREVLAAARNTEISGLSDRFGSIYRFQNQRRLKSARNAGLLQRILKRIDTTRNKQGHLLNKIVVRLCMDVSVSKLANAINTS